MYQQVVLIWFVQNYCSIINILHITYISFLLIPNNQLYNVVIFILCIIRCNPNHCIQWFTILRSGQTQPTSTPVDTTVIFNQVLRYSCTYKCKSLQRQKTAIYFFLAPFENVLLFHSSDDIWYRNKSEVNSSYVMCVSTKPLHCKDKRLRLGVFVIVLFELDCLYCERKSLQKLF